MRKEDVSAHMMVGALLLLGACGDDASSKSTTAKDGGAKDAGTNGNTGGSDETNTGAGAGSTGNATGGDTSGAMSTNGATAGESTGSGGSGTTGGGTTTGGSSGSSSGGTSGGMKTCSASAESACDFVVTRVTKNNTHPWFGMGDASGFAINGVQGKTLMLKRGTGYTFLLKQACFHPFYISSSATGEGDGKITEGVMSPTNPCEGAVLTFTPSSSANTVYYQCTNHAQMGGTIMVSN